MTKNDEARYALAETVHTAFRKGADGPGAHDVWTAIRDLDPEQWHNALCWMLWALNKSGWELRKKEDIRMSHLKEPTCEELFDDQLPCISRMVEDDWRHGVTVTEIYERKEDNTFWRAVYRKDKDGETHGLREGDVDIVEVRPESYTATRYVPVLLDAVFRPKKKK